MSTAAVRVAAESGLWLYVRGLERLMAMPAEVVERALLVDEAPEPDWPEPRPIEAPHGCLGRLVVRGAAYGAWDLGRLLGGEAAHRSWILLRLPRGGQTYPVALRADECLHVGALPPGRRLELPPGTLRGRAVFRAAFPAAEARGAHGRGALVGFEMDPGALFGDDELEITRALARLDV